MLPMRGHYNVTGANKVALWQTGYPFAVDFSHGYPRFNPGETSAADLLVRGEVDAALVVASDPASHMPWAAVKNLANIPVAVVDPTLTATSLLADVRIPAAFNGIEYGGTVYRMDGVALKTRKFVEPPPNCLPDVEVLENILHKVRSLKEVA
jgi:formylmethanofuran dehydrogenase subunit B